MLGQVSLPNIVGISIPFFQETYQNCLPGRVFSCLYSFLHVFLRER